MGDIYEMCVTLTSHRCDFALEGALAFKMVSVTLDLIREFHQKKIHYVFLHSHKNHWKQTYVQ